MIVQEKEGGNLTFRKRNLMKIIPVNVNRKDKKRDRRSSTKTVFIKNFTKIYRKAPVLEHLFKESFWLRPPQNTSGRLLLSEKENTNNSFYKPKYMKKRNEK